MEDTYTDNNVTYNDYAAQAIAPLIAPATESTGTVVVSIAGARGPNVTFGGTTGLTFTGAGATITVAGTLIEANGGTGKASYTKGDLLVASAIATLTKLAAAANGARLSTDSTQATGLVWTAASTGWSNATGTATRTALASYAGQTILGPTIAE